jgi:hypothetical protein
MKTMDWITQILSSIAYLSQGVKVSAIKGSGHFRVKIYAKPLPLIFQFRTGCAGGVFHTELVPSALHHSAGPTVRADAAPED